MGGESYPRTWVSPWDWPPSVGPWFHAGKNSTVSHSKVTACLFRKLHIPKAEHSLSQKVRGPLGETHSTECGPSEKARGPRVSGCQFLCAQMLNRVRLLHTVDCNPPCSSVHEILPARILQWGAISFSRGSYWPRDQPHISYVGRRILYHQHHLGSP